MINPVSPEEANQNVLSLYKRINELFHIEHTPLFFQYLGNFPPYLEYILEQIEANIQSSQFHQLQQGMEGQMIKLIHITLPISDEREDWTQRYKNSPAYYNFYTSLTSIYSTNLTLSILFIAIREAVKGWAVAVKQLSDSSASSSSQPKKEVELAHSTQDFVMQGYLLEGAVGDTDIGKLDTAEHEDFVESQDIEDDAITLADEVGVEKNLYVDYLKINQRDFFMLTRQEDYLILRVKTEEALLRSIQYLPHSIISPINQIFALTSESQDYPDLLYLLSEHFPVLAVQRMLFSGYMLQGSS